jgi:ABC-type branched-subunit amino acid transport system substrate-binding protein
VQVIAAALAAALVAAVGVAGASPQADPGVSSNSILIGGTFPLSGPASAYGTIPQAEKAYFDWFNAHSNIHGRKINFKFLDDAFDPSQTVPLTRQLVEQDHVFAIFNSLGTAPQLAVRGYLNQRKVPQVLVATGDSYWGTQYKQYPWTIGWQPDYPGEGKIYGLYIRAHVPSAKIGVLMQNDAYGKNYLAGLRTGLGKKKNLIVSLQPFDVTAPDVTQQMIALKNSGANTFVDFATPSASVKSLVTATKIGWHPDLVVINNVSASVSIMRIAAGAGADLSKAVSTNYLRDNTDPAQANSAGIKLYRSIMSQYYAKGNQNDANNIYGMSVAWAMVWALQHAGNPPTRVGLMRALTHMTAKDQFLLPGVVIHTTPHDHFPIEQIQLIRWVPADNRWQLFGKLYNHAR